MGLAWLMKHDRAGVGRAKGDHMATFEDIGVLMREIGPAADFAAIQEFAAEKAWLIVLREDLTVGVDLDQRRGLLVLSSDLGVPAAKHEDKINRVALSYAQAWYANDGAYLGRNEETGEYRLYAAIAIDGVEAGELGARIIGFAMKAEGWRTLVALPAADNQDLLEQMSREFLLSV